MKKLVFAFILFISAIAYGQNEPGIHFEHGSSWKEILEKAKAQNKFIFMDAFTTWCGPCKMMAKNIFPLPEVGDFFNENYINLKVQLDTTSRDNSEVKSWYADAHTIMTSYHVNAFPTYLFFSPEGKLVHRAVGSSAPAEFITKGKDALDPNKQYFTLAGRFNQGERNPAFLKLLAEAALNAYDKENISHYANEYLNTQKGMLTEENIRFLDAFTHSSKDAGFEIISKNQSAYDQVMGEGKAAEKIKGVILQESVFPKISESNTKPDWKKLESGIAEKYPLLAEEIISSAKVIYYYNNGDWTLFTAAFSSYLKKYHHNTSAEQLNDYAWSIFQNCNDMTCINQALEWSKKSVELTNNPMYIDTYANLLYKAGKKDIAIEWQQKALKLVKDKNEDTVELEVTLEKMKKGQKTW